MTPNERAENIVLASRQDRYAKATEFLKYVAAQIDEAEREAVLAKFEGEDCVVANLEREAYSKGWNAAKEKE